MTAFSALIRKQIHDTRWMLFLSAGALFALGWPFVFVTARNEARILEALASDTDDGRIQWMRNMGLSEQPSSVSIMMSFWSHPFILLVIAIWAISRGSIAVAAEIERGTLDLILSRPVSRAAYLLSHVLTAVAGLALLATGLLAGARVGIQYNALRVPIDTWTLIKPALNLAALGLPIYGYTLLVSAIDQVRWRPTTIGSVLTLAGFIALVVAMIPVLHDYWWRPYVERASIFKLYNPVDDVAAAELLPANLAILAGIGLGSVALAFLGLLRRDLPSNA